MQSMSVTYQRRYGCVWAVFLSTGQQLTVEAGGDEAGLAEARAAARRHAAGAEIVVERVDTSTGGIDWHGLRFEPLPTTFGNTDPSPAQLDQLTACWQHYRTNLPPDMRIELYGNRVRIEPGAFGARSGLINTLGRFLADAAPDQQELVLGPQVQGPDHAREQLRRACALPVPDGFIRIVQELAGLEEDGSIGAIYLVLKDRWAADRPF
ncbi:hypothetical protein [Dactylosporangium sp. NPDC048998]|uniref:hypothetical protein n=1 Tax=Dactylosporangium sp. NPDC048998 TaxID=3363976 RepID=UPI00371102A2